LVLQKGMLVAILKKPETNEKIEDFGIIINAKTRHTATIKVDGEKYFQKISRKKICPLLPFPLNSSDQKLAPLAIVNKYYEEIQCHLLSQPLYQPSQPTEGIIFIIMIPFLF
jgi:hypothetical protein